MDKINTTESNSPTRLPDNFAGKFAVLLKQHGITQGVIYQVADTLLFELGVKPSVLKVREALGDGSPNAITPLLDDWVKNVGKRIKPSQINQNIQSGLPADIFLLAESIWISAQDQAYARVATLNRIDQDVLHLKKTKLDEENAQYRIRNAAQMKEIELLRKQIKQLLDSVDSYKRLNNELRSTINQQTKAQQIQDEHYTKMLALLQQRSTPIATQRRSKKLPKQKISNKKSSLKTKQTKAKGKKTRKR